MFLFYLTKTNNSGSNEAHFNLSQFASIILQLGVSTESLGASDNNPWLRFCEEPRILGFDPPPQSEITERGQPVSMALSKYHILILFGDKCVLQLCTHYVRFIRIHILYDYCKYISFYL